jgi:hypothetical protein
VTDDRPKLQLAPEVVEALEREKASLLGGLKEDSLLSRMRAKRDAAREAKPRDGVEPLSHEQQALLDRQEEAKPRDGGAEQPPDLGHAMEAHIGPPYPRPVEPQPAPAAAPLTFDPDTLRSLASDAQLYQTVFDRAEQAYTEARTERDSTRARFLAYLQEHGIPVR